jgi:uncharacterized protein YjbI with pentapeptide repeats
MKRVIDFVLSIFLGGIFILLTFQESIARKIKVIRNQKSFLVFSKVIVFFLSLAVFILLVLWGYAFDWTGFNKYLYSSGQLREEKTLWDWMELLIVPLVLAVGGVLYNHAEQRRNRENLLQNTQEAILRQYFDDMTELLIDKGLRQSEVESEKRTIARAKTLMALRTLNGERKGLLLRFLFEAKLINSESPVIILSGADFSKAELQYANLSGANLKDTNFKEAQLYCAYLNDTNMEGINLNNSVLVLTEIKKANLRDAALNQSNLSSVNLEGSDLKSAHLSKSVLFNANLKDTDLSSAFLVDADLREAILDEADLDFAKFNGADLRKATLKHAKLWYTDFEKAKISKSQLEQTVWKDTEKRRKEKKTKPNKAS